MKKWKYWLSLLFVLILFGALWIGSSRENKQYTQTEYFMNTRCVIQAQRVSKRNSTETAVRKAFEEVARIHRLTDYYSVDSDVGRINAAVGGEPVSVDRRTAEILQTALEICEQSDGAFDITIAPVKDLWNFSGEPSVPSAEKLSNALEAVDWRFVTLDMERLRVIKQNANVRIDLGGAAKGYAADRAAQILQTDGITSAILDFGGNIVVLGANSETEDGRWRIGLQKPFAPAGEYGQKLSVRDKAVVTSGSYEQNFEQDGKRYHHIIDPQTGFSAEHGFDSVSIVHDSSLTADCLSTACFVLGEEKGEALARQYGAEIYFDSRDE